VVVALPWCLLQPLPLRCWRLSRMGSFLSNGPGDPASWIEKLNRSNLVQTSVPTFGICFGHQLLGRAFGARLSSSPSAIAVAISPCRTQQTAR